MRSSKSWRSCCLLFGAALLVSACGGGGDAGSGEATIEPPSQAPLPIPGFTGVTSALDPSGTGARYDVGGGNNHAAELSGVPWQSLKPGDVVNVYHRSAPYRHKVLLSEQGTAEHPITINGVTNAAGERPTLHADGAVSVNPGEWDADFRSTLLLINKRHATGTYGQNASHYRIQNLRLTGVRPENVYSHGGTTESYPDFGRAIWSAGGQYIRLQGMVVENNGAGLFIQANDDPGSLSKAWSVRGSKFENNGNGDRDHQIYFQAVSDPGEMNVVEGCYFGPPTPQQVSVAQLKMRATGAVVRYNWFQSSHRTLDIVEAQDAIPDWMYANYTSEQVRDYYRATYVYGNVFVVDFEAASGQPAGRPLHFGADTLDADALFASSGPANGQPGMRGYEAPTYFFHNTFYMRANFPSAGLSALWRGVLFDAENNNSAVTPTPGEVDAWNNIFEFAGNTRIGLMNRSGTTRFRGANLVFAGSLTTLAESDAFANAEDAGNDPSVSIVHEGTWITETAALIDPHNPVLDLKDLGLTPGSPAVGAAAALPAGLAGHPVTLQPAGTGGGATARTSTSDLGALQLAP